VADMIDMVVGRAQITFRNLELWSKQASLVTPMNHAESKSKFYLRFMAADKPGVLADIAGELGKHEISIASVIQHDDERTGNGFVPLVIMTHNASQRNVAAAVDAIDKFSTVQPYSVRMRVHE
jgi:homoserine dehydrogenase